MQTMLAQAERVRRGGTLRTEYVSTRPRRRASRSDREVISYTVKGQGLAGGPRRSLDQETLAREKGQGRGEGKTRGQRFDGEPRLGPPDSK